MADQERFGERPRWMPWVIALGLLAAGGWLFHLCFSAPAIRFLAPYPGAEWIVFPKPATFDASPEIELTTTFWKRWTMAEAPRHAELVFRAFTRAVVSVNGQVVPVPVGAEADWKTAANVEVGPWLRPGANEIEITVANRRGPPALWAVLDAAGWRTGAGWDASCAGSAWRPALPATEPLPEARDGVSTAFAAFDHAWRAKWLTLVALGAAVLAGALIWRPWVAFASKRGGRFWGRLTDPAWMTLALVLVGWTLLITHNTRLLPRVTGFDGSSHISYIEYLLERHALPLANEGMVMYNPPLYYALGAGLLRALSLPVMAHASVDVLRGFALAGELTQFVLIAASLRLLFPENRRAQALGIAFAAALPANVYVAQYVTNEWLVGVLVTATVYCTLRGLSAPRVSVAACVLIGACLGAALLTKVTALLAAPFIVGAVAIKLQRDRALSLGASVARLGAVVGMALVLCGWHYVRVWVHLGKPIVGAWDPESGLAWWQDQGYVTFSHFLRFGQALANPVFSARAGFWDGVYSTLWADGLCGGMTAANVRPPWDYSLMTVSATLALVLTVLLVIGIGVSVRRFVRGPGPSGLIVNGILLGFGAAFVVMYLKVPCYGDLKAFYGLVALLPLTIVFADVTSLGWLGRGTTGRIVQGYVAVWALTTFATYWIDPDASSTQLLLGYEAAEAKDLGSAERHFAAATRARSAPDLAWMQLASTQAALGRVAESRATLETALRLRPTSVQLRAQAALQVSSAEEAEPALRALEQAMVQAPNNPMAYGMQIHLLQSLGRADDLIDACREALCTTPNGRTPHLFLGLGLAARPGAEVEAKNQLTTAIAVDGDSVADLQTVAWILATHPSAALRDADTAAKFARKAIDLAHDRAPTARLALAAAEADLGDYEKAANSASAAATIAESAGNAGLAGTAQKLAAWFRSGRPFHRTAPPPE